MAMMMADGSRARSAPRAADIAAWVAVLAWGILSTLLMSLSFLPGTVGALVWSPVAIAVARSFQRRPGATRYWRPWVGAVAGWTVLAMAASVQLFLFTPGDRWFWTSAMVTIAAESLSCFAAIAIVARASSLPD